MATSTVENYIKQIYALQFEQGVCGLVSMGDLANALKVTPGTATSMVKSLAREKHVEYTPRVGVALSDSGKSLALHVLRRHRLVELFLVKTLGMEWHEIHDEAERLEHAISDRVLAKIDASLGYPKVDPHGDSIPSPSGVIAERNLVALDECEKGKSAMISRIEDQAEDFLQYLESNRLTPGNEVEVENSDRHAGILSLRFLDGNRCSLGFPVARKIQVELHD